MFKRLRRMKNNKLAWDDDTAKEIAAWLATYAHYADTGAARAERSMMATGDVTAEGQYNHWLAVGKAIRWLLSNIRVPVAANDLALAYIRHSGLIQEKAMIGDRKQLQIPMGDYYEYRQIAEGESRIHDTGTGQQSIEGSGSGTIRRSAEEDTRQSDRQGESETSG